MTSKKQLLRLAAASLIAMSTFTGMAHAANGNGTAVNLTSQTEAKGPGLLARLFGAVPQAREQKVSYDNTYYGSADYICSPSGFGMRSRCSRRGF